MHYFARRYLAPLTLIAVSFAGLLLVLKSAVPDAFRHAAVTSAHAAHRQTGAPLGSALTWLTNVAVLGLHLAAYTACTLLVLASPVAVMRLRARRQRAEMGRVLCAELRLGRDDHASPYEIGKVFDGIAGALRPSIVRRPLAGPPTLALRIVSEGGARSVRFLVAAPHIYHPAIAARLRATYPDTRLIPIEATDADPFTLSSVVSPWAAIRARLHREQVRPVGVDVLRVKKARRWVWALATTKDYEHSLMESLVSVMHALPTPCVVELLLTPAPTVLERYTGHALRGRERRFMADGAFGATEPGVDSAVAKKHIQGAVEGIGRAWWWFDYRVIVLRGQEPYARQVAGVIQETRGENYLRVRAMRLRRRLYAWRSARSLPQLYPALWTGALSSAEVASLWHLPTLRLKGVPLHRISAREITATSAISRDPAHALMRDEYGPVGIHPRDRRKGWMLLGAGGAGKTAALAPHVKSVGEDENRALIVIDPKEDFARLCMSLIPARRTVHYLDLGAPRYGLNILTAGHLTPEIRADIFISVIRELAGETAVGPRSDLFLRAAIQAVTIVESVPALHHVWAMLDPYDGGYREWVTRELRCHHEIDFVLEYWEHTFPRMVKDNPRFITEAIAAPANKIARFLTSPSLNLLMTHPIQLDLESIIEGREILIVNGSKGAIGEDNANLFCSMLIILVQRALHQIQRTAVQDRVQAALVIDEAHNVFIPSFATLLSEGRSGGIEVAAAFQYTGQIEDERVKKGIKSLLQNISIFRQRDFEDARAAAALAMEVFQDNIRGDTEDQRRIRIDPMDIVQQPDYRAVNLWLAQGIPQPAATANTLPMEQLVQTPDAVKARGHHEREQRRRGDHPHDHGRYIRPPLVHSIKTPIMARYRSIHVDLPGWNQCPPLATITRVAVVLKPKKGEPIAYVADSPDGSQRRYTVELPTKEDTPGWLPPGAYGVQVMVWITGEAAPRKWTPTTTDKGTGDRELTLEIVDEARRPLANEAEAA
jgi:TraM recognition site of TraD and TraG